jgi:hypothetical protein
MAAHSEGRVTALADAFKAGWHAADDAGLPDRTHHGIRAMLDSAEHADLVAFAIHEALERAVQAVRATGYTPRYVTGANARRLCDPGPRVYCPMCGKPGAFQLDGGAIVHNNCEGKP